MTRLLLVLIWLGAAAVAYLRLPGLTYELRHSFKPWQVSMVLQTAAAGVWLVTVLAIVVTMVFYGWRRQK